MDNRPKHDFSKEREPLTTRLLVHELRTGETIREKTIDMRKRSDRTFLFQIFYWAYKNGKSVELLNVADDGLA